VGQFILEAAVKQLSGVKQHLKVLLKQLPEPMKDTQSLLRALTSVTIKLERSK
jgi:Tfp pilus assembly protein PilO